MSRYEVVNNLNPNKVLLVTTSLNEACWFVGHNRLWLAWPRRYTATDEIYGNKFREKPPILAPDVGTIETEWHIDSIPGELQKSYVMFRDGHPLMISDDEVLARAERYRTEVLEPQWHARRAKQLNGRRRPASRWYQKPNAHHRTMRLDDKRDDEVPALRPGARVPDAWDARDGGAKVSKCWKDQTRRRRQWKPIDMSPQDDGRSDGEDATDNPQGEESGPQM